MIRKISAILIALACGSFAMAQTITHQVVASQFAQWQIPDTVSLTAGANVVVLFSPCVESAGGKNFQAVKNGVPLKIVDPNNPSIDEVVTPSSVVVAPGNCTASITTVNAHPIPYYVISGSQGLYEAIGANALTGQQNTLVLDALFHQLGGGITTIYAAPGSANLPLEDVTVAPYPTFRWNGSHYVGSFSNNSLTAPTLAAGAAAGTSSAVTNATGSTANLIQASITTGTATTAGTLFTETFSTATFGASTAPNCTVQSVGPNSSPALTVTGSFSTDAILTVSVATAPPTATNYLLNLTCQ